MSFDEYAVFAKKVRASDARSARLFSAPACAPPYDTTVGVWKIFLQRLASRLHYVEKARAMLAARYARYRRAMREIPTR